MTIQSVIHLLLPVAAVFGLASCKTNTPTADPYASNAVPAGGYNPYPGQSGYATNAAPSYQQPASAPPSYQAPAPPPEPAYDPYAYSAPKTSPKKTGTTKKTVAKKTSPSSKRHTVKKGDTLYAIARSGGTTVAKLKSANGLASDVIHPGQVLRIP